MKAPRPQSGKATVWLVTGLVYVVFAILVWFLGSWLALGGANLWLLRLGLWVLGLAAAGLVLWFFAGTEGAPGTATSGGDDVETTLAAAAARLASARAAGTRALRSLPMVVVFGPEGSTKTSVLVHSGLEPDLLAGEVFHGDGIGPTPGVNVWFTHHTVLLEAGGKLASDGKRWNHLIRRVRPRRLMATLTGRPQAARAAVVSFSCEELLKPGSVQAVPAAARELRALLTGLAQGFGVRLPVYVLFSKADRIPYFAEFVHHLSREEAQEVLGATLRWPGVTTAGLYADREFQRLNAAFDRLLAALAAKRLDLLARETDQERQAGGYEFPRELRKIVPATIQFLVDLCRPSQLDVSPVLRGFYYTGVRAVVVSDAVAGAAPRGAGAAGGGRIAATQVFDQGAFEGATAPSPSAPGSRRMPQWLFLGALFRDVLLRDRAPGAVAAGARSVALLRRAGFALIIVASVVASLWSTVSYGKNRQALSAARSLRMASPNATGLPTAEELSQLDTVRAHLQRLSTWGRWGWYKGTSLYPELRRLYYERFDRLLLDPTRGALVRSLDSLPETPQAPDQYGRAYDGLKAYLMATSHPEKIAAAFLVPRLMDGWANGRLIDSLRLELARRQFAFYATTLCRTYACGTDASQPVADRTCAFLSKFGGVDRVYQLMLSKVSESSAIRFDRSFPGRSVYVVAAYQVPGAFTERGWAAMQKALKDIDQFSQLDDWVCGQQQRVPLNRRELAAQVRARYLTDYEREWSAFLSAASVASFASATDAARKLAELGGPQSPLLQLFSLVAQNTDVDSQTANAFQPVHAVMPAKIRDRFVVDSNRPYVDALKGLGRAVEQAATLAPGAPDALAAQTTAAVGNAQSAVDQLTGKFKISSAGSQVGAAVTRLLNQPIDRTVRLMATQPAAALNSRGAQFCRSFASLLQKYPFSPNGPDATLGEVAGVFEPNTGALWQFYSSALQNVLMKQGAQFVPKPGASVSPTPIFVRFFNRIAAVTDALWPSGAAQPQFDFTIKLLPGEGLPAASFSMDGQVRRFTRTFTAAQRYSWAGSTARDVRLAGELRGREESVLEYGGTWALFKLLQRARWHTVGVTSLVQWVAPLQGQLVSLEAELNLGAARPILKGDYFTALSCVSQIVP